MFSFEAKILISNLWNLKDFCPRLVKEFRNKKWKRQTYDHFLWKLCTTALSECTSGSSRTRLSWTADNIATVATSWCVVWRSYNVM